jgi:transposase, IS5 family
MMKQMTLGAGAGFARNGRITKRAQFLAEMERVVPWATLCAVVEPVYPKPGNGRPPIALERMLRMYFLAHWFNLADGALEEAVYDSEAMRRFIDIDLARELVPDETTVCKFRHLLERNNLGARLFEEVGRHLQAQGLKVATGTMVDATIINAPSSTKNQDKARDPEMHQTRKGQQWYFGAKMHIGVDSQTKMIHSVVLTAANVHDKHALPQLLHGQERRVYADAGYAGQQEMIHALAPKAKAFINERAYGGKKLTDRQKERNRNKSRIRARVEHAFGVIKGVFKFTKVRYRGLAKNGTRAFVACALANLYIARGHLLRTQGA